MEAVDLVIPILGETTVALDTDMVEVVVFNATVVILP